MVKGVILVDLTDQADARSKTRLIEPRRPKPRRRNWASRSKTSSIPQADHMMLQLSSKRRARSPSTSSCRASSR